MTRDIELPDARYLAALERQRDRIKSGIQLETVDSDAEGDKELACSWGLCSRRPAAWPDAQDHLWPDDFKKLSRVAPLYLKRQQLCPLDTRKVGKADMNGCYYSCLVFQAKRGLIPSRAAVIHLYEGRIEEFKNWQNTRQLEEIK